MSSPISGPLFYVTLRKSANELMKNVFINFFFKFYSYWKSLRITEIVFKTCILLPCTQRGKSEQSKLFHMFLNLFLYPKVIFLNLILNHICCWTTTNKIGHRVKSVSDNTISCRHILSPTIFFFFRITDAYSINFYVGMFLICQWY